MGRTSKPVILVLLLVILLDNLKTSEAQRSLQHWKRDLEHRIRIYEDHQNAIHNIIASSIYAPSRDNIRLGEPIRVSSNGNVRFSDLIVPAGALKLSSHLVGPTVHILVNKTKSYVNAKANELWHIQSQLVTIISQLDDPGQQYIYKGVRGAPQPQNNFTHVIMGTRVFRQAQYAHSIEAKAVSIAKINSTDVSRVIDDTYLRNTKLGVYDRQHRLFFEGRKTFWNTVFSKPLKSGCCDRLKPIHTSRMMMRSTDQDVLAPILVHSRVSPLPGSAAIIRQLSTKYLYNRPIDLTPRPPSRPDDIGILPPTVAPNNFIHLHNLISIRQYGQPEILKAIVFANTVNIDEALLSNSFIDNRLVIGIASLPEFAFDLAHDNYLLKFSILPRNFSQPSQHVSGTVILDSDANFLAGIQAPSVNRLSNFRGFISESIVYTNRPATIKGPIQFNALPTMLNVAAPSTSRRSQNVLILHASQGLEVELVNGMRIPQDLVLLPSSRRPGNVAIKPTDLIHVRGPRRFANQIVCYDALSVNGLVNGIELPAGVIPLHLNDFMSTVGYSNLWFMDGISMHHMTIQAGRFDDIDMKDVNGGAQSIILNSMSTDQQDGTTLIRAPLRVMNLHLINDLARSGQATGRLNGFRPQEVLELNSRYQYEILHGPKKFLAPVEASECIFNDINQVANWTNHLIRIDKPNTVQTVHTKLAFTNLPTEGDGSQQASEASIDRLHIEFQRETESVHYAQNWNFSPEFYLLHQALMRSSSNYTGGRYRVLNQLKLIHPSGGLVNNIPLSDIIRLDQPFNFADVFTMVGKVEVLGSLGADRIQSNYPIDAMDLMQFNKYRIPIMGSSLAPIRLNSFVLSQDNQASFVQCRLLNGLPLNEFVHSIMSLTRPQAVAGSLVFQSPVSFEGMVRTKSSLGGIKNFQQFAQNLKNAKYTFEDGLQCNSVIIKN